MNIEALNNEISKQVLASEYKHKRLVFGMGPMNPKMALIGEAPGGDEEEQGKPFVGKAGKNLTELLEAVGLSREEIYIGNAVKLRPTKLSPKTGKPLNRTPNGKEIDFFRPFLFQELDIVRPEYIVTLGNIPLNALADKKLSVGDCHGKLIHTGLYNNVFSLYHPAAIIYNQDLKSVYLEDMKALRKVLGKNV